uniref:Uncharacterized protein n=1 Tax=Vitis vinifera TaxID=29760 RepID=A5AR62_VITVI|nr:hypothetical protein VITISV_037192 [Vitis vinifera]
MKEERRGMAEFEGDAAHSEFSKKKDIDVDIAGEKEVNDCPIEEVRLTVPITDDPTEPCLTFRTMGARPNIMCASSLCESVLWVPG